MSIHFAQTFEGLPSNRLTLISYLNKTKKGFHIMSCCSGCCSNNGVANNGVAKKSLTESTSPPTINVPDLAEASVEKRTAITVQDVLLHVPEVDVSDASSPKAPATDPKPSAEKGVLEERKAQTKACLMKGAVAEPSLPKEVQASSSSPPPYKPARRRPMQPLHLPTDGGVEEQLHREVKNDWYMWTAEELKRRNETPPPEE